MRALRRVPRLLDSSLVALACGLGVLAGACERKAPGPAECRAFALAVAGVAGEEGLGSGRLRADVDELTRECLVTPYDRQMLRCFDETGRLLACRIALERRRKGGERSSR